MIRLSKTTVRYYRGRFNYMIALNVDAGSPNVHTVYVLNADDPVTIGRELPLADVRKLIIDYEQYAPKHWFGNRGPVLDCMNVVNERRRMKK